MPLWIVILFAGAAGCGWLFLKAKETEVSATYKKIEGTGTKSVRKMAKAAAKRDSIVEPPEILKAEQPVTMSRDVSSQVAKQLEKIMEEKQVK